MATETLQCDAGHQFTRDVVRGRKPHWCPKHQPPKPKPAAKRTERQSTPVKPVEPKPEKPKRAPKPKEPYKTPDRVNDVLKSDRVGAETKNKLRYIERELTKGRDDGLGVTRRAILREAYRQMQVNVPDLEEV